MYTVARALRKSSVEDECCSKQGFGIIRSSAAHNMIRCISEKNYNTEELNSIPDIFSVAAKMQTEYEPVAKYH